MNKLRSNLEHMINASTIIIKQTLLEVKDITAL